MGDTESNKGLDKYGVRVVAGTLLGAFIQAAILFAFAGRFDIPRAWVFIGASFVFFNSGPVLLYRLNPDLLNQRGRWKRKRDTKSWDKVLLPAYGFAGFYMVPAVIGLEAGRYGWSHLGIHFAAAGLALYALGTVAIDWAMTANPYFEASVRIQKDRSQKVITRGPYRFVRHPGYLGAILWVVSPPLIVGSVYGLVPAAVAVILLILRTHLEDRMLHNELEGYADYAHKVRFRLIPGLW
jgi:protein-S-isoprenylcysteine O-methyltransferase Ste14